MGGMQADPHERRLYLDHAATTPVREEVLAAMLPYLSTTFGNPSSLHAEGQAAREALETARASLRAACGAGDFDLVFCGSGTEADNLAMVGSWLAAMKAESGARGPRRRRWVASSVEHSAVLNVLPLLQDLGGRTTLLPVDGDGRVDPDQVRLSLGDDVLAVSLMAANNEVGTLEPVAEVGRLARERGAVVHVDAVQHLGKLPLRLADLPVDLVTVSAHKVYGPRGIAGLFVRRGTPLAPLLRGGAQEGSLRAGTENVAAAVGFARAVELAEEEREGESARLQRLRDLIRDRVVARFPGVRVNTPVSGALPGVLSLSFPGIEGESLVRLLDWLGVAASTGSACNAGARKPSHVLRAMGRDEAEVRGSLRLSLGRGNDEGDVEPLLEALGKAVGQLEQVAGSQRGG